MALYLALNWHLTDLDDIARIPEWEAELASRDLVTYSSEEVEEHLAMSYAGRFQTKRLGKKHKRVLDALHRGQSKLRKKAEAPA